MADQPDTNAASEDGNQPSIYDLAQRLQPALRPAEAVILAQELVDHVADALMPEECPQEAGEAGWKSRWGVHGPQRYAALREALRARSPQLFGGL